MGMDVYGTSGNYFRNNVWWWRPLADYCLKVAPGICNNCECWQSNDGDGLDANEALQLAKTLQAEVDSGRCAAYADAYERARVAIPLEECNWCNGTGVRDDHVGVSMRMPTIPITEREHGANHPRLGQTGWCNGCNGRGKRESFDSHYPFSVENVQQFIDFLNESNGFEIW